MKKIFVLLGTLAAAALFFSCANSSSDNSAALLGMMNSTKTTVSKTIKIGGVEYSYTIVDGQPQTSGGVSVAADGTVTITAADGSKVAVKGETITYTTADSKVYVGSGSSGDITLVNQANPNDKITAAVTSQTKTESAQQQSEASRLPPSVGTNELAGKTFKMTSSGFIDIGLVHKFETNSYISTSTNNYAASVNNTAYSQESKEIYSYTYDSNSKVFYEIQQNRENYFVRNGVKLNMPNDVFSTDAEFVAFWKKYYKIGYDLASDDYIETQVKDMRRTVFSSYGYTDSSGATPVSNEIVAIYNEANRKLTQKKLISPMSYSVSDTGLKLKVSNNRFPTGKDFNELYNYYKGPIDLDSPYPQWQIKDNSDNTTYTLYQFSHIMKSDNLLIYKVSSVDANAIHTCATGTRTNTTSDFSFTNESKTFKYTTTKSDNGAVVDIEGLGKINIVYATPATIPDFTSGGILEFTLQQ